MQVLMIGVDLDKGGIGNVIMTLYRSLIKCGVKCDLTYYKGSKPNSNIINELNDNGSTLYEIFGVKQAGLGYITQVYRICKKKKYDVIHIHTSLLIWMAAIGAKLAGIQKRVGHAHGAKFLNYPESVLMFLEPMGRILNRIFCTDFVTCSQISARYTFGREAKFIPNYVSPSEILSITKNEINKAYVEIVGDRKYDYIFVYAGCLDGVKNAIFLLDVIFMMKKRGIKPLLLLIGKTIQINVFKETVEKLGIEDNVQLLGYRMDCKCIVQFCDYYISASKTEGMSMAMIEAQMSGIPCFASSLIPSDSNLRINLFYQIDGFEADHWSNEIQKMIDLKFSKIKREKAIELLKTTPFYESKAIDELMSVYKHKS
ncbi:glycosyltransferase [Bacillota bacterium LCP21S3_F9]